MSKNKKFIIFYFVATIALLILTFIASVVCFNYKDFWSSFFQIICGGLFGSFGVMLLSEIKSYSVNKKDSETIIYSAFLNLYSELKTEISIIDKYLNTPDEKVPYNLLKNAFQNHAFYYNQLATVDYSLLFNRGENLFYNKFIVYRSNELFVLGNHPLVSNNTLQIAINLEEIKRIEEIHDETKVPENSSGNPYLDIELTKLMINNIKIPAHKLKPTFEKIKNDTNERLKAIDEIQTLLSKTYPKRYNWEYVKKKILDSILEHPLVVSE